MRFTWNKPDYGITGGPQALTAVFLFIKDDYRTVSEARLVRKENSSHKSEIKISRQVSAGGKNLLIIGGPCAVESQEQMNAVAEKLGSAIQMIRGGVYKPRTSPYSFQGLGAEGIKILAQTRQKYRLPVITEVMSQEQIESLCQVSDMLQLGSRNMQNFDLLKALGGAGKPVLLKRGLCATIEEMLLAAEYIVSHGNPDVVLCERGIRSFDPYTRNVLDLGAVVALKQLSHLPVVVDPSHACGRREMVSDLCRAAIACGADGLMVECHPDPEKSVSDARQALSCDELLELLSELKPIAAAVGRRLPDETPAAGTVVPLHQTCPVVRRKARR
jgi:3-deoxy-7-phosphoheptulonate synthase